MVSGPIGCGKTTLCRRLVDVARRRGLRVAGVLTPAVVEAGIKVGIEAVDLRAGEGCAGEGRAGDVRLLARTDRDLGGTRVGQYRFDDRALDWVAARCVEALTERPASAGPASAGKTLVFVDEIGRLELDRGGGLARTIPLLAQVRDGQVIVIVRDTLLDRLLACVREAEPRVVTVDPQRREEAWVEVSGLVFAGDTDR